MSSETQFVQLHRCQTFHRDVAAAALPDEVDTTFCPICQQNGACGVVAELEVDEWFDCGEQSDRVDTYLHRLRRAAAR